MTRPPTYADPWSRWDEDGARPKCAHCRAFRSLGDLLEVTHTRTGEVFFTCRPRSGANCFRAKVRSADVHHIAQAARTDVAPTVNRLDGVGGRTRHEESHVA